MVLVNVFATEASTRPHGCELEMDRKGLLRSVSVKFEALPSIYATPVEKQSKKITIRFFGFPRTLPL